jgi:hypothetical protein
VIANAGSPTSTPHVRPYGVVSTHDSLSSIRLNARDTSVMLHPVILMAKDRFPGRAVLFRGHRISVQAGSLLQALFRMVNSREVKHHSVLRAETVLLYASRPGTCDRARRCAEGDDVVAAHASRCTPFESRLDTESSAYFTSPPPTTFRNRINATGRVRAVQFDV